jgi:hypothetical protein
MVSNHKNKLKKDEEMEEERYKEKNIEVRLGCPST